MSRVTVVIPVWDSYCDLLAGCVATALEQQPAPHVIVVDNASTAPLPPLPDEVEVVRSAERLTVGAARNLALDRVTTPLVCFFDADNLLLPGLLARGVSALDRTPGAVSAVARYESWNPDTGERLVLDRSPRPSAVRLSRRRRLFALANLRFNTFPVDGAVHRTEAVRAAGGFGNVDVGEDWILGTLLAFRGRIAFVEQPGFLRRVQRGSLWFRPIERAQAMRRSALLRERVAADSAVPRWVKLCLPLLARVHDRDVRQATPGGFMQGTHPLLGEAASG